jgi:hypothetical protein
MCACASAESADPARRMRPYIRLLRRSCPLNPSLLPPSIQRQWARASIRCVEWGRIKINWGTYYHRRHHDRFEYYQRTIRNESDQPAREVNLPASPSPPARSTSPQHASSQSAFPGSLGRSPNDGSGVSALVYFRD